MGPIRLNVGSFMQGLFLKGAFQGTTPQQAYFVKCDAENNPQPTSTTGIVNILVGFAPLYPAEFVVIQIQQMAGQSLSGFVKDVLSQVSIETWGRHLFSQVLNRELHTGL